MESVIGKQVKVIATEEELKRNGISSPVRANGNGASSNVESFCNKIGKIIGESVGRDYGDGTKNLYAYVQTM